MEDRQYDGNMSYMDGRQTEIQMIRQLENMGLIVDSTKGNEQYYDLSVIDPQSDKEFIVQVKSSKERLPYIRCNRLKGLLKMAKHMKCGALIILVFTSRKEYVILDAEDMMVVYTTDSSGKFIQGTRADYNCQEKEKWFITMSQVKKDVLIRFIVGNTGYTTN